MQSSIHNNFMSTSTFTTNDWTGAAHFYVMAEDLEFAKKQPYAGLLDDDRVNLDMLIQQVNFQHSDFDKIEPHIGQTFSHHFYGKRPMVLSVGAVVFDLTHSYGKAELVKLYRWLFRLYAVCKTRVVPVLYVNGMFVEGAMLDMKIVEDATNHDVLQVDFQFLVFNMHVMNDVNEGANKVEIMYNMRTPKLEKKKQSETEKNKEEAQAEEDERNLDVPEAEEVKSPFEEEVKYSTAEPVNPDEVKYTPDQLAGTEPLTDPRNKHLDDPELRHFMDTSDKLDSVESVQYVRESGARIQKTKDGLVPGDTGYSYTKTEEILREGVSIGVVEKSGDTLDNVGKDPYQTTFSKKEVDYYKTIPNHKRPYALRPYYKSMCGEVVYMPSVLYRK